MHYNEKGSKKLQFTDLKVLFKFYQWIFGVALCGFSTAADCNIHMKGRVALFEMFAVLQLVRCDQVITEGFSIMFIDILDITLSEQFCFPWWFSGDQPIKPVLY